MLEIKDCHRVIHGKEKAYSRYYVKQNNLGATRIDRIYASSKLFVIQSEYIPLSFSDHWGQNTKIKIQDDITILQCPRPKTDFKIKPKVVDDIMFQSEISENYEYWEFLKHKYNYNILEWWECIVKVGIKNIAIDHTKKHNKENQGKLNLLILSQLHYAKKIREGDTTYTKKLNETKMMIKITLRKRQVKKEI